MTEPRWGLLGVDGIERLPAVQWKPANIGKMAPGKHAQAVEKLVEVLGV